MKRVYVAGSYSADNVISVLDNIRNGIRASTEIFLAGFSPFCPWLDFHFQLMLRDDERLGVMDYYEYSMSWLRVSECVFVLPNSEKSRGTNLEIMAAENLKIPIYYDMVELIKNK